MTTTLVARRQMICRRKIARTRRRKQEAMAGKIARIQSKNAATEAEYLQGNFPTLKYHNFKAGRIIIEAKPQVRTIQMKWGGVSYPNGKLRKVEYHRLSFPYVFFMIGFGHINPGNGWEFECADKEEYDYYFSRLHVAFSKVPLEAMQPEDHLYFPLLPNISNGLWVCMGNYTHNASTLRELADHCIGEFWQSQFTMENHGSYDQYDAIRQTRRGEPVFGFKQWKEHSIARPKEAITYPWQQARTLNRLLQSWEVE
jgi:hypothetical protein